jgi:hypothetical protein
MLSVLSDICQADPCLSAESGVAHTNTDKYRSCSTDDVVSDVETAKKVKIVQNVQSDFDNFQITF